MNDNGILSVDNLQSSMLNIYGGHLSFVDYNNDGNLDISMTGVATINFNTLSALLLYKWENEEFVLDENEHQLSPLNGYFGGQYNHDWGDYDNDGDLDLVSGGLSLVDYSTNLKIFKNTNGILEQDTTQFDLIPLYPCAVLWMNINGDSHLDLITLGKTNAGGASHIYINDGTGKLNLSIDQVFDIPSTLHAISAADFNNDGYEDLAVSHLDSISMHTNIYTNKYV